jgi:hypothetical protein
MTEAGGVTCDYGKGLTVVRMPRHGPHARHDDLHTRNQQGTGPDFSKWGETSDCTHNSEAGYALHRCRETLSRNMRMHICGFDSV